MDELFSKRLPVIFKCLDKEDRKVSVHLKMELLTITSPLNKRELSVRLTDENDLFFLYSLCIGEEDFQSLKVQQGLLVDFCAFPRKFMDLLNMCLHDEHSDVPKFVIHFITNCRSGCESSTATLNVVENNPFKHLIHLSLKFMPGSDSDIKAYLADCLKQLKDANSLLQQKYECSSSSLTHQLKQTQESLSAKSSELDTLRVEWNARLADMRSQYKEELASKREKAIQSQSCQQQKHENDRRESEQAHTNTVSQLESRLYDMETSNKELTERKYRSESLIRELTSKLSALEEETCRLKQDATVLRNRNISLDSDAHNKDKTIGQLNTRIAVLEQEVRDKEELAVSSSDSYNAVRDAKHTVEENLAKRNKEVSKLEGKVKVMGEELKKGNEIIKKLQGEIKCYHAKVKVRTQIATEQEKLLQSKDHELETLRQDLSASNGALKIHQDENKSLTDDLERTTQKLEECRKLLKTNENVIQWLNKQINEQQLTGQLHCPFGMSSAGHCIRPPTALSHNFAAASFSSSAARDDVRLQNGHLYPGGMAHPHSQPNRVQQVLYTGNTGSVCRSALPVPSARTTQPPSIQQGCIGSSVEHGFPPRSMNEDSDHLLDPKYFQRRDDNISAHTVLDRITPSPPLASASSLQSSRELSVPAPFTLVPSAAHFSPSDTLTAAVTNSYTSVRVSQHMVVSRVTHPPPLASSYFPGNGKPL